MDIPIIGKLLELIGNFFLLDKESKIKLKAQKIQAKIDSDARKIELKATREQAEIQRVQRQDVAESNYDLVAQENARNSFVDELMITWVLTIVTLIFVPSMQPYVIAGFQALEQHVPVWFQLVFCGAFISKLGLRFLFSGMSVFGQRIK